MSPTRPSRGDDRPDPTAVAGSFLAVRDFFSSALPSIRRGLAWAWPGAAYGAFLNSGISWAFTGWFGWGIPHDSFSFWVFCIAGAALSLELGRLWRSQAGREFRSSARTQRRRLFHLAVGFGGGVTLLGFLVPEVLLAVMVSPAPYVLFGGLGIGTFRLIAFGVRLIR
jgi:hypothetical protein